MYYALIDMRNSCSATTALAWGSLKQVADMLISECEMLIHDTCDLDGMSEEELVAQHYCEFDDYKALVECDDPIPASIENFSFTLSDCTIEVGCLVEGYSALVEAWDEYKSDKWTLDSWSMVPEIEETEENLLQLDEELRSLNDDLSRDDYEFFVEVEDEEFCDE